MVGRWGTFYHGSRLFGRWVCHVRYLEGYTESRLIQKKKRK